MTDWTIILRWVHIISGAAWLGEVITINFVLVPALSKMNLRERRNFILRFFPRVFRLASLLSVTSIVAGLALSYAMTGWQFDLFLTGRWGMSIIAGGTLGLLLTLFHFFVESRLGSQIHRLNDDSRSDEVENITRFLRIIPRVGLGIIAIVFVLMMYAARGI